MRLTKFDLATKSCTQPPEANRSEDDDVFSGYGYGYGYGYGPVPVQECEPRDDPRRGTRRGAPMQHDYGQTPESNASQNTGSILVGTSPAPRSEAQMPHRIGF
ncbi:hypothetical protein VSX64_24070 [Aurantimonas sp. C2-6-R+9]|uniref:hypothetical protein n=1 Tax=Aurantimonas sp. C2-6-R+9 TaxID=3114365 RepID=UPI002E16F85E|nr:hypothetical protein [Aurantimonas sp. C2-6-R+9]